jgi:hypothetical protein
MSARMTCLFNRIRAHYIRIYFLEGHLFSCATKRTRETLPDNICMYTNLQNELVYISVIASLVLALL